MRLPGNGMAQGAVVGHAPVQPRQLQKALYEPGRLPEQHTKQHLQGQARLDRSVAVVLLTTTLAARRWLPVHLRIKPNRKRTALLQRRVV